MTAGLLIFLSNRKANHIKTTHSQAQCSKDSMPSSQMNVITPQTSENDQHGFRPPVPLAAGWGSGSLSILLELCLVQLSGTYTHTRVFQHITRSQTVSHRIAQALRK